MTCPLSKSLCEFKNKFIKFWKTENNTLALVRDVLVAFILVLILLTSLWAYTGQWFGAPMVAIESGSMMHEDEEGFGRIGYIDAGDMVLLVKTEKRNDIVTRGSDTVGAYSTKNPDNYHYGDYGDVIVYHPYGFENGDQIIHRAMCWLKVESISGRLLYTVEEYGIHREESVTIHELGLNGWTYPVGEKRPDGSPIQVHSGFITMGDNNNVADQSISGAYAICSEPVKAEWVSGKARGEIPWIGTLNLFFNDITSGGNTVGNVPADSIQCLVILIAFLISIPISLDLYDYFKNKNTEQDKKIQKKNNKQRPDTVLDQEKKPPFR